MSGPELAAIAGIGKGHLSKIENHDANISIDTLEKLANALRLSPAHLINEVEQSAPQDQARTSGGE